MPSLTVSQYLKLICCQSVNQALFVCPGQKQEVSIPINDLKVILNLAREQYLKIIDSTLPSTTCLTDKQETAKNTGTDRERDSHCILMHMMLIQLSSHGSTVVD